jgi:hypothetical protein
VLVNRLKRGDASWYQRVSQSAATRDDLWNAEGLVPEIPIMLKRGGRWNDVPVEITQALVRCPKHGSWAVDRRLLRATIDIAIVQNKRSSFQTRSTS